MEQGKTPPGRLSRLPLSSAHSAQRLKRLGRPLPGLPDADQEAPDLL